MRKLSRWFHSEAGAGIVLLLPLFLYFAVFQLLPMLLSLGVSFTEWNLRTKPVFVGLDNYSSLLFDQLHYPNFWPSFFVTLKFIVFTIPAGLLIALILAALLNANIKREGFFKTAFYIPNVTASVAVAAMWIFLLDPQFGLLNQLLSVIPGLSQFANTSWLRNEQTALPMISAMTIWMGLGYNILILLAGMKNIPEELYEAARIDGANAWSRFSRITMPMIQPTLFFLIVTGLIAGFQAFDQMYLMSNGTGAPNGTTMTYLFSLYNHAFKYFEMGIASAMSYLLLLIILLITWINFKFIPQKFD